MNALTTQSTELVQAAASIVAAYVGNPNPKIESSELPALFTRVHAALAATQGTEIAASPEAATVADMIENKVQEATGDRLPVAARESLAGSVVYANEGNFDPAEVWPEATDEQRAKFVALIDKFHIQRNAADGRPISRLPVDRLVTDWKIFDPISGEPFTMLKRHLARSYGLDINELQIMYHLGENFPQTAPLYSESKRQDAARSGLGKGSREEKAARAAAKRLEAAKASGRTVARKAAARAVEKPAPAKKATKAVTVATAKTTTSRPPAAGKKPAKAAKTRAAKRETLTA